MFRRRVCRAVSNNLRKKLDNLRKRFIIICGAKNEREKRRTRMKYIKQILIILTISFVGELLKQLLPLPVPAVLPLFPRVLPVVPPLFPPPLPVVPPLFPLPLQAVLPLFPLPFLVVPPLFPPLFPPAASLMTVTVYTCVVF